MMSKPIVPPAAPDRAAPGLRPREILTVIGGLLVIALLARLGVWQLDRAHYKQALAARIASREAMPALALPPRGVDFERNEWRPVLARGQWAPQWTVYLQNRQYHGVSGFWVLTPLRLQSSDTWVMVLRGWAGPDVHAPMLVPPVPTPRGPVDVHGRLAPAPSQMLSFQKDPPGAVVRQNVQLGQFADYHHIHLLPYVVQQIGAAHDGLVRDWPAPDLGMQTNYGYAFQWFAMSATCIGLLVYFTLRTLLRRRRGARGARG